METLQSAVNERTEARRTFRNFFEDNARTLRGLPASHTDDPINVNHTHEHVAKPEAPVAPAPSPPASLPSWAKWGLAALATAGLGTATLSFGMDLLDRYRADTDTGQRGSLLQYIEDEGGNQ